jgi:hypothetical protein
MSKNTTPTPVAVPSDMDEIANNLIDDLYHRYGWDCKKLYRTEESKRLGIDIPSLHFWSEAGGRPVEIIIQPSTL